MSYLLVFEVRAIERAAPIADAKFYQQALPSDPHRQRCSLCSTEYILRVEYVVGVVASPGY